jgi:uncharacterized protein
LIHPPEPQRFFAKLTVWCIRHNWIIILLTAFLAGASAYYANGHFTVNSDVSNLISGSLPWRKRELAYQSAFPQETQSILAVLNAPTPELADAAARAFTDAIQSQGSLFRSVQQEGGGKFFSRNQLLYMSTAELADRMRKLRDAAPIIKVMAADPSLRGLSQALTLMMRGVSAGRYGSDSAAPALNMIADALDDVLSNRPATFSWQALVKGAPPKSEDLRRLVTIWPELDYHALEPGKAASAAVLRAATNAALKERFDASVQLTGPVPIADQQFSSLRQGIWLNAAITGLIILIVLWLALRSVRIVSAVSVTVLVGLLLTAALGLVVVGSFNPISVAFAFLFVGLGADFAIQYSVRYRAERHKTGNLARSLVCATKYTGARLLLAAAAAAAGFLSFLPTNYRGVAELGLIAGLGMAVAYVTSVTLLPALLSLFKPPSEPRPLGYAALAKVDRLFQRRRRAIVFITAAVVLLGLPSLVWLRFDFNPFGLRSTRSEAVAVLKKLSNDRKINPTAAEVLTPPTGAEVLSKRLSNLPEVQGTRDIDDFIPRDQEQKRRLIAKTASVLGPALETIGSPHAPDSEDVKALRSAAKELQDVADETGGPGAQAATRLAGDLKRLADGDPPLRRKAQATFVQPLLLDLRNLRQSLHPDAVTHANLPDNLVHGWTAPDGRLRVEVMAKGNTDDSATLIRFAQAVLSVEPNATGPAIEAYEWGSTILTAFAEAGLLAMIAIAILLWVALRRIGDVLLTLIPLVVAAAATLEICALTGFALNYANIIALPALLGIGVAFKIYYVMEWRAGERNFLRSVLTRAVFFSAVMTATAFGSLCFSNQPGISSMGKLLALSLACTLASAALFQPALMGPPRESG